MDPKTRLRRHSQLWEAGTARVQRLAFGSVIFAVVILLNVIVPYSERDGGEKLSDLRNDVEELQKSKRENNSRIEGLKRIGVTLDQIKKDIERAPWSDDIQELVKFCRGNCPLPLKTATQPTADKVIRTIASELQMLIVERFRVAIDDALMADEFGQHATDIKEAIDDWRDKKLGTEWYPGAAQAGDIARRSAMEAQSKLGGLSRSKEWSRLIPG